MSNLSEKMWLPHKLSMAFTDLMHPILYKAVKKTSKIKIRPFEICVDSFPKPCIFVCNHTNSYDVPTFSTIVKTHFFLLAGIEDGALSNIRPDSRTAFLFNKRIK